MLLDMMQLLCLFRQLLGDCMVGDEQDVDLLQRTTFRFWIEEPNLNAWSALERRHFNGSRPSYLWEVATQ